MVAAASGSAEPCGPEAIVESLGFGLAQARVLALATPVWLVDGIFITLTSAVASNVARDFAQGPSAKAFLPSIEVVGLAVGCLIGGSLGDHVGRKPPIIASYFGVACATGLLSLAGSYAAMLITAFFMGISMGLGMSSSLVMQSELSPAKWRMSAMTARLVINTMGQIIAAGLLVVQDPHLKHVDWRWCYRVTSPSALVMCILAATFLPESPVFLATTGRTDVAREGFESMMYWNGVNFGKRPCVEESAAGSSHSASRVIGGVPLALQLRAILGPSLVCRSTLAAGLACFAYNLLLYGHNYAEPQVLTTESTRRLAPAVQILLENCWYLPGAFVLTPLDRSVGARKIGAAVSYIGCAVALAIFGLCVDAPPGPFLEAAFQVSTFAVRLLLKLASCFSLQIAAEIYPPLLATMGNALCVAFGRLGSVMAPFAFELCLSVTDTGIAFYFALTGFALVVALLIATLLPACLADVAEEGREACKVLQPLRQCQAAGVA